MPAGEVGHPSGGNGEICGSGGAKRILSSTLVNETMLRNWNKSSPMQKVN